ncbi:MAG: DUF58 domain-containing protein, partial [Eubacteriales bacterium]
MLFVAILLSLLAVYLIQMKIYARHTFDDLSYRVTLSAEEVFTDEDIFMYEEIKNAKNLPLPSVKVDTELPQGLSFRMIGHGGGDTYVPYIQSLFVLAGRDYVKRRWRVTCRTRGVYNIGEAIIVANDLLGFNAQSKKYEAAGDKFSRIVVLPKPINLDEHFTSSRYHSGDITVPRSLLTDPLRVAGARDYTALDPMKRINWKLSAAHSHLMVNVEEYTQRHHFNIILNMQSRDIEKQPETPSVPEYIEDCVTVCASLIDRVSGDGIPVRMFINTPPKPLGALPLEYDGGAIAATREYAGRQDMIEALRLLASLTMNISLPTHIMLDRIAQSPEYFSGGGNIVMVSAYLSERMINFARTLEASGVHVMFYITTTYQNAENIPGDIEVYYRMNAGGGLICMLKTIRSNGFAQSAGNGTVRKTDAFDRLYKALAVCAVICVLAPFFYSTIFRTWLMLPLTALLVAAGYFMQAAYGRVAGVKRVGIDASYESMNRFFSLRHSAVTCTAAFIVSLFAKFAVDAFLRWRSGVGMDFVYDAHSLYPYLALGAVFISMFCGIFCWFFPYDRVISTKTVFPLTAAFLIGFFLTASNSGFITLSLIIYIFCALVILNQSYISRAAERTKTALITPSMRFSNIAMIAVLVAAAAGILILMTSMIVGIAVSVKALLYLVLASVFRGGDESYTEAADVAESVDEGVFNMSAIGISNPSEAKGFFMIFAIILLGLIILFIISRKIDVFRKIGAFFAYIYQNIIDFFSNLFSFAKDKNDYYVGLDYRDVAKRMSHEAVREYSADSVPSPPLGWREYQRRLSAAK